MAYPDSVYVQAPTSQRVAEFRLLHSHAGAVYEGLTAEEVQQIEQAVSLADPRYGNDPEAALTSLREQGWTVFGTLKKLTVTTKQAADTLGVSVRRVQALIESGALPAEKHGRDYVLFSADVQAFGRKERPAHRPAKAE